MAKKKNQMLASFVDGLKKVINTQSQQTNNTNSKKTSFQLPTREMWQQAKQKREEIANNIISQNRSSNPMTTSSTAERLNNGRSFFNNINLPTRQNNQGVSNNITSSLNNGIATSMSLKNKANQEKNEENKDSEDTNQENKLQNTTKSTPSTTNTNVVSTNMNMSPGKTGIQRKNAYGKQTDITKTPEYQEIKNQYNEVQKKAESGDEEAKQVVEQANKLGLFKEENKSKLAEFINKKNREGNIHVLSQEELEQRKSEAKNRLSLGGAKNWNLDSIIDYITDFSKLSGDLHAIGAPDFVTKPLDAIAPAGATVKTYGHHVETGLSNAANALIKDKKHLYEDTVLGDIVPDWYRDAQVEAADIVTKKLDDYANSMDEKNAYNSSVANNSKTWGYINDHFAPTLGEMTPSIVAGIVAPETQVPSTITQFFVSKGSYYRDAEQRGMDADEAMWYSNIMGLVEAGTEALTLKNAKKIGTGVKELANGTLKKSVKDVGIKQTIKNLGGDVTKDAANTLLKDTVIGMLENATQEALTEPINEVVAQLTGGEDAADWNNMKDRMVQSGIDGALLEFILGGVHAGIPSAQNIKSRIDSNLQNNNAPLKGVSLNEIVKMSEDVNKVIDTEKIVKDKANQTTNKLKDYLLSQGIETTSILDKAKSIDETHKTNLTKEIKEALNNGKLDKNTYSELNKQLDQISQFKNSEELLNHAQNLDDTLELKGTEHSLTQVVEKLTNEAKLDNETYGKLKEVFNNIDNNMPYVTETSDNKKIDVFRDDMSNFMNNSEQSHNFAKSVESIIEKTGLNIRLNNQINENGRIYNNNGETTIEINPNSERAGEFVLMHELTHAIGNKDLKQTILDYASKNENFNKALESLKETYGQNDVTDEVMADISGQLLGNEEFINNLAVEQPSKFKQIYNAVKSWVKKFTGTYGYEDFVRDVEMKWQKAFNQNKNNITENIGNNTFLSKDGNGVDIDKSTYIDYNNRRQNITENMLAAYSSDSRVAEYFKYNHSDEFYNLTYEEMEQASAIVSERISQGNDNGYANDDKYIYYYDVDSSDTKNYTIKDIIEIKEGREEIANERDISRNSGYTISEEIRQSNGIGNNQSTRDNPTGQEITSMDSKESTSNSSRNNKEIIGNKQTINQESENHSGSFNLPQITKEQQLNIIKNSNPMEDDYHTGIRSIDDIKTLQEALNESEYDNQITPDLTSQDIENAIKTGNITIYSSNPIKQGTFVTPSKMEAQSYAGNNNVYSKEVSINDVAWIDTLEGQYANIDNKTTLPQEDNKGRTLTKEQQEYFKDVSPEVKDENGNLKTFYHGSNSQFTIFDIEKGGRSNDNASIGFWFTEDKSGAEKFAKQSWWGDKKQTIYEGYLNLKNPKIYESVDNSTELETINQKLRAIKKNREDLIWHNFYLREHEQQIMWGNEEDFRDIAEYEFSSKEKQDNFIEQAKEYKSLTDKYKKLEQDYDNLKYSDSYEQFRSDIYALAGKGPQDANFGGTGMYLEKHNELVKQFRDKLISEGYDGIIIKNTKYDNAVFSGENDTNNQYITFYSNQFKNVDNTNPTNNPDIRYSKQSDKWQQWLEKNFPARGTTTRFSDILLPTADTIQNSNNITQNNIKNTSDSVISKIEQGLKDIYPVELDQEQLKSIANNIAKNPTEEGILEALKDYRTTYFDDETADNQIINEIKSTIRNTKLDVSNLKNSITDYNDLRKTNFGKLKLGNDGSKIDTFYQELSGSYPDYFDSEISNEADQLNAIVDFINEDFTSKTEYQLTDEDIKDSGLIAAVTSALSSDTQDAQNQVNASNITQDAKMPLRTSEEIAKDNQISDLEAIREESEQVNIPSKKIAEQVEKELANKEIEKSPTIDFIKEKRSKEKTKFAEIKDELAQKFVNKGHYIDKLAKASKNQRLTWLYDRTMNSFNEAQISIGENQINSTGEVVGKSIIDIFKPAEDKKLTKEFNDYLLNKHNIARYGYEKGVFGTEISAEQSKQIVDYYEKKHPEFKEWGEEASKFNDNNLIDLVDNGLVSDDMYKKLRNMYPDYVPTFRDITEDMSNFTVDDRVGTNTLKKATGSNLDILSVQESMAEQTLAIKKAIRMNNLGLELYQTLHPEKSGDVIVSGVEFDPSAMMTLNGDVIEKNTDGTNMFTIFKDGEMITFKISDELYTAFQKDTLQNKINNSKAAKALLTPLEKLSKFQRELLTTYSIGFSLNNPIKDFSNALVNTKFSDLNFIKNYPKALFNIATKGEWYESYKNNGGTANTYFDYEKGLLPTKTKNPIKKFANKIKAVNEVLEQAPRLTEYISTIEHGGTVDEALYNAADITVNFKRGGDITKAVNKYGANFLNASVQGLDKTYRNITGQNGVRGYTRLIMNATIASIAPAIINNLLLRDDDDYEELPDYIKDNYFLFKIGDNKFFRIPKGNVSAVIGSIARRANDVAEGKEVDWKSLVDTAVNQMAPNNPVTDNVLAPLIQAKNNKAWYGGDIVGTRLQKLPAAEQYDEKTDKFSKFIGKTFNISPKKVNYIIDQYSGGIGDVVLPMLTPQAENNILEDKFTTNSVMKSKYPSDFFTQADKLQVASNSEYATDEDKLKYMLMNELKTGKNFKIDGEKISTGISDLYAQKRAIQNSTVSDEEKKEELEKVQEQINKLARYGIENNDKIEIKGNTATIRNSDFAWINENGTWKKVDSKTKTKLKQNNVSLESYADYQNNLAKHKSKLDTGESLKQEDKIKILRDMSMSNKDKKGIYSAFVGSTDTSYEAVKNVISINSYLDYKMQSFSADKDANGNSISGSRKQKIVNYLNSKNMRYEDKLIILGMNNKLTSSELSEVFNYINSKNIPAKQKIAILKKVKGFKINGNSINW